MSMDYIAYLGDPLGKARCGYIGSNLVVDHTGSTMPFISYLNRLQWKQAAIEVRGAREFYPLFERGASNQSAFGMLDPAVNTSYSCRLGDSQ